MFYVIFVFSGPLMDVLYHTPVLLDLVYQLVSSGTLMAVLYHTRVLLDLDGFFISYSCPLGP